MAWTANLLSKTQSRDKWVFVVSFTDGSQTINEQIEAATVDPEWLRRTVKGKLDRLNARAAIDAANPVGPVPDPPAPPPVDPAPAVFQAKLHKLEQMMKAVDLGVINANLPALTQLQTQIRNDVQADPTLLDLF